MPGYPPPFRVGLILTDRCDASCVHCWFGCGPERTATMSRYDAQDYVDKAARAGSVEWLSLTGGEPMLYSSLVENLVAYASGRGLRTELVTNCNWAESPERAVGTLRRLRDAGLDVLNISTDDFHQAHVPIDRVRHAYGAAKGLGVKMVVMVALRRGGEGLTDIASHLGDEIPPPGAVDQPNHAAIGIESGFIPVGRGASLPRSEWFPDASPLTGACGAVLRDLGVKPSGELLPCCSASATLPGFSLGNLDDFELGEALERAWGMDVFKVLSQKGPMGLHKETPKGVYVNKCHLCYETLRALQ
jgi:hypothetical protein